MNPIEAWLGKAFAAKWASLVSVAIVVLVAGLATWGAFAAVPDAQGPAPARAALVFALVAVLVGIPVVTLRAHALRSGGEPAGSAGSAGGAFRRVRSSSAGDGTRRGAPSPAGRVAKTVATIGGMEPGTWAPGDGSGSFRTERALPTFASVGGMESLKREIAGTIGLMLRHPDDAAHYGIEWNGILLHGPPGVGKTFFARAIAGEYGMDFIHVSTSDLISGTQGESARNIAKAFETALDDLPCLLFFDEFDSVAQRRDAVQGEESRRMVNQLLSSLEACRNERRLLVMAATTGIERLEPAVLRPGRFDWHIRIDLPDAVARRAIFEAELSGRPAAQAIAYEEVVRRTEGMTPAAIAKIVDTAALEVFREATAAGRRLPLDTAHLLAAVERFGGQDRPTIENFNWDSLVLPERVKRQLKRIQSVIEDPESARRYGVEPPTGLLMAGPPGTGKTTVAKVLAAQSRCSFYAISGADVMSKWVGEAEANIRKLFERARENRPSIVFIDEIDALAARRGAVEVNDSRINQLLAEIDGVAGQRGVFVIGATNRPDQIDPALLRGGRLSRTFQLELPDEPRRLALLELFTARMPTAGVDLEELARRTDGLSPSDIEALCQEAALAAMDRNRHADPIVLDEDFDEALARLMPDERVTRAIAGDPF